MAQLSKRDKIKEEKNYFDISDAGKVRENNEDAHLIIDEQLFIVADGMGGHKGGEVASRMAVNGISDYLNSSINRYLNNSPYFVKKAINDAIIKTNENILIQSQQDSALSGMGTTVVAAFKMNQKIVYAHVGDSRLYKFSSDTIEQLTKDHSEIQGLIDRGIISKEDARDHPRKNVISQAVGTSSKIKVDTDITKMNQGDILLLCTDGLTDMVEDDQLLKIVNQNKSESLEKIGKEMMTEALTNGGLDNITLVLIS